MCKIITKLSSLIRQHLPAAHVQQKSLYDKWVQSTAFHVSDHVWLFVGTVWPGHGKKCSSLFCGLYTVLDNVSAATYRIDLIGSHYIMVVHHNWLKLCFGEVHPPSHRTRQALGSAINQSLDCRRPDTSAVDSRQTYVARDYPPLFYWHSWVDFFCWCCLSSAPVMTVCL